jgi:hypothetical protein
MRWIGVLWACVDKNLGQNKGPGRFLTFSVPTASEFFFCISCSYCEANPTPRVIKLSSLIYLVKIIFLACY